jgi:aspartate kinase
VTTLQDLSLHNVNGVSTHRLPTAVAIKEGVIVLNITSNRKSVSHGFLARIFAILDRFGIVVDLISTSEVHISMTVEKSLGKKALDRLVADLQKLGTVSRYSPGTIGCMCVVLRV